MGQMESSFKNFLIGFIVVMFITVGFAFVVNSGYVNGVFSQLSLKVQWKVLLILHGLWKDMTKN